MAKIKDFFKKNEVKIVLLAGFLLVSALSFEAGVLWGQKRQSEPLVIEKQVSTPEGSETVGSGDSGASGVVSSGQKESSAAEKAPAKNVSSDAGKCPYVGSKNSKKFYLSTCPWAKQIKPENVVCFATPAEAIAQGRTESKCD